MCTSSSQKTIMSQTSRGEIKTLKDCILDENMALTIKVVKKYYTEIDGNKSLF